MEKEPFGSTRIISSKGVLPRIAILAVAIVALAFCWFSVRWQLGFMLADLTSPTDQNAKSIGAMAVGLSPGDPFANWLAVNSDGRNFTVNENESRIHGVEKIVRLAPYSFNWWGEVGRAFEQANDPEKAEQAFLRAIELAPNYTYPHWQLGNFYLRSGNDTKAFSELQIAAENNVVYREQVFSIAWDYYEKDSQKLEQLAGNTPSIRAGLAKFYAVKEKPSDSLRLWNSLTSEEKLANSDVAKIIAQGLYDKKFFRQAVEFVRDLAIEPKAQFETVLNGSFEDSVGENEVVFFDWRIPKTEKIDVKLDATQKRDGNRSLRISFNTFSGGVFYSTYQIIAVSPSSKYILSFWVKTEGLKSGGMPTVEVVNANGDKILATTESLPSGTNDWKQINLEFTSPAEAEGIIIRTSRAYCGENCPIVGSFWYDDFQLKKME